MTRQRQCFSLELSTSQPCSRSTEWSRRERDGVTMVFLGLYEDDVVRTPAGWRFARRELVARTLGKAELFTGRIHDPVLRPAL